ncbi:hypothetical protein [Fictibacillus phosphorivorans]|uniref:hypothetical protein n=1 Tax=Fictibacillus phosphorivorans TaxID=1221500 RepID=UPI00203DCB97|nr:hypothetical protein [Fictibacillus phosphorivorans]MCM3718236.1 hypothetical protein [Fictibacillus phosphorivorans]MCM3775897.1 hypothetical protein [Fictibacillus phosphorivorans]
MSCKKNKLSAREVAQFICKRVIANEGFDDIEIEGKLVCVGRDFIAIKTDEREVFYLPLNNVRNLAVVSDKCCDNHRRKVCNDTFRGILKKLINCRVRVNDGGEEEIEGILTAVNRTSIQIVEEETLNIVTIPIGAINFIVQAGELGDHESSNCRILCCRKEDPCGKKKDKCCKKKDDCCKKKDDCKKESPVCCKKEESSSSFEFWCKKESSSSSNICCKESSSRHHICCKKEKKKHCDDLESRGWFRL